MIEARDFVGPASALGFTTWTGVPCSFLTPFIDHVIASPELRWLSSANEGDAVATAAGISLAGGRGAAMMQNSGLGNAVSPLTSLTWTFRLPVLLVCTQRGAPGVPDEPQHALMGPMTPDLLATIGVPCAPFPERTEAIGPALDQAMAYLASERRPYALLMQKGAVAPGAPAPVGAARAEAAEPARVERHGFGRAPAARPTRAEALARVVERAPVDRSVVVATTGYTGRELGATLDRPNHFYMVGSMGCASSLGLGLALELPDTEIIVIEGDGAALMRMGNFSTLGAYGGANLTHVVLDNEAHESTGGQPTVSATVDFALVAAACGYRSAVSGDDVALVDRVCGNPALPGPRLLHLKIRMGTRTDLPRPRLAPEEVAARLTAHVAGRRPPPPGRG